VSPITLYARGDLLAVSAVPGCEAGHVRPVDERTGKPVPVWSLTCDAHEKYYRGDGKPKILKYQVDKNTGRVLRQERVADSSPMFSSTPDTVPLTPDEEATNAIRQERGRMQIEMLQALAALRATGIEVPPEAMWLLERELPEKVLKGTVVCVNGHDVPAGNQFCGSCGASMTTRAAVTAAPAPEPEIDLAVLHPQSLKKLLRDRGLPDKGTKEQMIRRLREAA